VRLTIRKIFKLTQEDALAGLGIHRPNQLPHLSGAAAARNLEPLGLSRQTAGGVWVQESAVIQFQGGRCKCQCLALHCNTVHCIADCGFVAGCAMAAHEEHLTKTHTHTHPHTNKCNTHTHNSHTHTHTNAIRKHNTHTHTHTRARARAHARAHHVLPDDGVLLDHV
jgi:hypothetical protein